jgi:hypothetical protein
MNLTTKPVFMVPKKSSPVITTSVPAGPAAGETSVMPGVAVGSSARAVSAGLIAEVPVISSAIRATQTKLFFFDSNKLIASGDLNNAHPPSF